MLGGRPHLAARLLGAQQDPVDKLLHHMLTTQDVVDLGSTTAQACYCCLCGRLKLSHVLTNHVHSPEFAAQAVAICVGETEAEATACTRQLQGSVPYNQVVRFPDWAAPERLSWYLIRTLPQPNCALHLRSRTAVLSGDSVEVFTSSIHPPLNQPQQTTNGRTFFVLEVYCPRIGEAEEDSNEIIDLDGQLTGGSAAQDPAKLDAAYQLLRLSGALPKRGTQRAVPTLASRTAQVLLCRLPCLAVRASWTILLPPLSHLQLLRGPDEHWHLLHSLGECLDCSQVIETVMPYCTQ